MTSNTSNQARDNAAHKTSTLYVDLDGTLIKSDVSFESLLELLKLNLFYLALIPLWLSKGLAYLKSQIARRVDVPLTHLPLNTEFWQYLQDQKNQGRRLVLISASNERLVGAVGDYLQVFDEVIGSDATHNLKAKNKLARIQTLSGDQPFAYAGNSTADIAVWAEANQAILVNCERNLGGNLSGPDELLYFDSPDKTTKALWQAMRPHQWLKNGLVFLPLLLAHQLNDVTALLQALIAFASFSCCASSVYLLNDLVDLHNDRLHRSKCQRPFASGQLPLVYGFIAGPLLLLLAFALALLLPLSFAGILLLYWFITTAYSLYLKKLFLLDVAVLAILYTLRIYAGAAAVELYASFWLVSFSLCLFLGLAIVKRVTELVLREDERDEQLGGRAYSNRNMELLTTLGMIASASAVIVFVLYINDSETRELYSSPMLLWLICPLLIVLLGRIWRFARRGDLHEDPLVFAISDHPSQAMVALCGLIIWLAT